MYTAPRLALGFVGLVVVVSLFFNLVVPREEVGMPRPFHQAFRKTRMDEQHPPPPSPQFPKPRPKFKTRVSPNPQPNHAIPPTPSPAPAPPPALKANGVFAFGVYVGGGLSSLSIALAKAVGWRGSAYAVASYGLLLSVLVRFTVREPVRTPAVTAPAAGDDGEVGGKSQSRHADEDGDKDYTITERWVWVVVLAGRCRWGGPRWDVGGWFTGSLVMVGLLSRRDPLGRWLAGPFARLVSLVCWVARSAVAGSLVR